MGGAPRKAEESDENTLASSAPHFPGLPFLPPAGFCPNPLGTDAGGEDGVEKSKKKSKKKAKAKVEQSSADGDTFDKKYSADLKEKPTKRYFRFEFKQHPAIRMGKWFRMDFRLKFQHDFRSFGPEVSTDEGELSNLRKFRVGIQGYVTKDFEYEIEREIRDDISALFHLRDRATLALWRDVYGNWRYFRGRFAPASSRCPSNGPIAQQRFFIVDLNFRAGRACIMAHGKLFDSRISYQAGMFEHDGWKAHTKDHERSGEGTFAGRVVIPPFNLFKTPAFLKKARDLELGLAFTESPLTEGLRSLRGRTWVITHNWFDRINVRGHRLRLGAELNWQPGPFTVQGEVIRVRDQRLGQGIRGDDLPDLIARGWYFTTGWVVTGEKPAGGIVPRRDFIKGRGFGAVQLAARYEQLRFGSSEHPGLPSRSSRAANIFSTSERIATFGTNWYPNRFVTVQFNAIREVLEDPNNLPIPGVDVLEQICQNPIQFLAEAACGCPALFGMAVAILGVWAPFAAAQTRMNSSTTLSSTSSGIDIRNSDWIFAGAFLDNTYYPVVFHWIYKGKDIVINDVGIRSRGHGSRSPIKPNLRVDINRYSPGQTFLGLGSFVLKANNQDPSMLKERSVFKLWDRTGLPASREAFSRLYVNNVYYGVFLLTEELRTIHATLFE